MALNEDLGPLFRRAVNVDRVLIAGIVGFALVAAFSLSQAEASLKFVFDALVHIAPFLLMSVLIAAAAKATSLDKKIGAAFAGSPVRAILIAAVFGAMSPFCSCGVVPIIAGFLGAGVPLAPIMAFWLASPLMDPQMFLLTWPVLGLEFTIAKTLSAMTIGAAAGFATLLMMRHAAFQNPLLPAISGGCGTSSCGPATGCGAPKERPVRLDFWREDERRDMFTGEAKTIGWFLFKWMALAFFLESLMVAYIPADMVAQTLGGGHWWTIPASILIGVPTYMNGFAAIPTVAILVDMGMAPGAGLGFMLAGGITSIPAAMAVFAVVKRQVFFWYLLMGGSGALIAAYSYQAFSAI